MSDTGASSQPVLADPVVLPRSPLPIGPIPAGVAVGAFLLFACWRLLPGAPPAERYVPHAPATSVPAS